MRYLNSGEGWQWPARLRTVTDGTRTGLGSPPTTGRVAPGRSVRAAVTVVGTGVSLGTEVSGKTAVVVVHQLRRVREGREHPGSVRGGVTAAELAVGPSARRSAISAGTGGMGPETVAGETLGSGRAKRGVNGRSSAVAGTGRAARTADPAGDLVRTVTAGTTRVRNAVRCGTASPARRRRTAPPTRRSMRT